MSRSRPALAVLLGGVLLLGAAWARFSPGGDRTSDPSGGTAPAAEDPERAASPCAKALGQGAVCAAANGRAIEIMSAGGLTAVTVVQDVRSAAFVVFAASRPSAVDVATPVLPLSLSKLLLAASWWEHRLPESGAGGPPEAGDRTESVHDMLVGSIDSAGRRMAVALRHAVGAGVVMRDFERYGFGRPTSSPRDEMFWGELAPAWTVRLVPAPAYADLDETVKDGEWAEVLSLGESRMRVTALHVSRFLQAVGNDGVMRKPSAREEGPAPATRAASAHPAAASSAIMRPDTARRLQSAMLDTVERGSARSISRALAGGWRIGGKTGTGPGLVPAGSQMDGWFAGLIFGPRGKAEFTIATFVRQGGRGGGNAARVSAELARYLANGSREPAGGPR